MNRLETRPGTGDCDPFFLAYTNLVPEGVGIFDAMEDGARTLAEMLGSISDERASHRYATGKWSVRELLGHLVDCERILGMRSLWFARGDAGPLPGFDEDAFVAGGAFDKRSMADLLAEYAAVRTSSLAFFRSLTEEALDRRGDANGLSFVVRVFPWIIAGHELHHVGVLRDRYGVGSPSA